MKINATVLAQSNNSNLYKSTTAQQLIHQLQSPSGLMLLGCLGFAIALQLLNGVGKKGKLATGYWGSGKEKIRAAKVAKKQMRTVTRNNVALYIGTPNLMTKKLRQEWETAGLIKKLNWKQRTMQTFAATPTLYVPDAQRGICAIGAAGSGKTFSVIDPLIRSALDQGFPVCLYDFKYPAQTKRADGKNYTLSDRDGQTVLKFSANGLGVRVDSNVRLQPEQERDLIDLVMAQIKGRQPSGAFAVVGQQEANYYLRVQKLSTALVNYAKSQNHAVEIDGKLSFGLWTNKRSVSRLSIAKPIIV